MAQTKDFGFGSDETAGARPGAQAAARRGAGSRGCARWSRAITASAYESAVQPAAWDEALWQQMVELGWTALAVPEAAGGARHEDGRRRGARRGDRPRRAALAAASATLLATAVLRARRAPAHGALERIAGGDAATLAVTDARRLVGAGDTDVAASARPTASCSTARRAFVQDARKASLLRRRGARARAGVGLYVVAGRRAGRHRSRPTASST